GVALPVSALVLEVVFHRRERPGHPAGVAERAQAQVHAVAEALGGGLVQELRQLLAEPRVVLLRSQRARAVALARLLVAVDQVHVRGEVELAAAELAEREPPQTQGPAARPCDGAVAFGELAREQIGRAACRYIV